MRPYSLNFKLISQELAEIRQIKTRCENDS
jgi:hypothetical protein